MRGLKACQEPSAAVEGMGGTYFFLNEAGRKVAICKPCDEEPLAPNNPKVRTKVSLCFAVFWGLVLYAVGSIQSICIMSQRRTGNLFGNFGGILLWHLRRRGGWLSSSCAQEFVPSTLASNFSSIVNSLGLRFAKSY